MRSTPEDPVDEFKRRAEEICLADGVMHELGNADVVDAVVGELQLCMIGGYVGDPQRPTYVCRLLVYENLEDSKADKPFYATCPPEMPIQRHVLDFDKVMQYLPVLQRRMLLQDLADA